MYISATNPGSGIRGIIMIIVISEQNRQIQRSNGPESMIIYTIVGRHNHVFYIITVFYIIQTAKPQILTANST